MLEEIMELKYIEDEIKKFINSKQQQVSEIGKRMLNKKVLGDATVVQVSVFNDENYIGVMSKAKGKIYQLNCDQIIEHINETEQPHSEFDSQIEECLRNAGTQLNEYTRNSLGGKSNIIQRIKNRKKDSNNLAMLDKRGTGSYSDDDNEDEIGVNWKLTNWAKEITKMDVFITRGRGGYGWKQEKDEPFVLKLATHIPDKYIKNNIEHISIPLPKLSRFMINNDGRIPTKDQLVDYFTKAGIKLQQKLDEIIYPISQSNKERFAPIDNPRFEKEIEECLRNTGVK